MRATIEIPMWICEVCRTPCYASMKQTVSQGYQYPDNICLAGSESLKPEWKKLGNVQVPVSVTEYGVFEVFPTPEGKEGNLLLKFDTKLKANFIMGALNEINTNHTCYEVCEIKD